MKLSTATLSGAVSGAKVELANVWGSIQEVALRFGVAIGLSPQSHLDALVAKNTTRHEAAKALFDSGSTAEKAGYWAAFAGLYEAGGTASRVALLGIQGFGASSGVSGPENASVVRPMAAYGFPAIEGVSALVAKLVTAPAANKNAPQVVGGVIDSDPVAVESQIQSFSQENLAVPTPTALRNTNLGKVEKSLSGVISALGDRASDAVQNKNPIMEEALASRMSTVLRQVAERDHELDLAYFNAVAARKANVDRNEFALYD
jgi:hypothetical protein